MREQKTILGKAVCFYLWKNFTLFLLFCLFDQVAFFSPLFWVYLTLQRLVYPPTNAHMWWLLASKGTPRFLCELSFGAPFGALSASLAEEESRKPATRTLPEELQQDMRTIKSPLCSTVDRRHRHTPLLVLKCLWIRHLAKNLVDYNQLSTTFLYDSHYREFMV